MEKSNNRCYVLSRLKKRNSKEHSFKDIIKYSNKLLENMDFLQKENLLRKIQTTKTEQDSLNSSPKSTSLNEEMKLLPKYQSLQKELIDCRLQFSGLANQVIDLKNMVKEKDLLLAKISSNLQQIQNDLKSCQSQCTKQSRQIDSLKSTVRDKSDDLDALNITYSSIENKRNDLEIENNMLKSELSFLKKLEKDSPSKVNSERVPPFKLPTSTPQIGTEISNKSPKDEAIQIIREPKGLVFEFDTFALDTLLPKQVLHRITAHDSDVNSALWVNKTHLITAGSDRKIKLWELCGEEVNLKKCVRDCNSSIFSLDMDMDSDLLLCASGDFASRVWTLSDFTIRHTLTGHSGKVMASKFMHETNKIVSCSADQTLKLWDLRRKLCLMTQFTGSQVNDVVSKDPNVLLSGHSDKSIRLWDIRGNKEGGKMTTSGVVTSLDLSRNGLLLCSERIGSITLYDLKTYKVLKSMTASGFELGCDWTRAKFSPDNQYCCCGSKNGTVFIWNLLSGFIEKDLHAHNSSVISSSWSHCGTLMASSESDKKCFIWSNK